MKPYLGVLLYVLGPRNRAFSAPKICTVEADALARLVRDPALEMSRAATVSDWAPKCPFLLERYTVSSLRYSAMLWIIILSDRAGLNLTLHRKWE